MQRASRGRLKRSPPSLFCDLHLPNFRRKEKKKLAEWKKNKSWPIRSWLELERRRRSKSLIYWEKSKHCDDIVRIKLNRKCSSPPPTLTLTLTVKEAQEDRCMVPLAVTASFLGVAIFLLVLGCAVALWWKLESLTSKTLLFKSHVSSSSNCFCW